MVRGLDVASASALLQFSKKEASRNMEKLLWSAINNFEQKSGEKWENGELYVKEVRGDGGRMLKRIQPAPQGRAHRIRKRSNHVTIILGSATEESQAMEEQLSANEVEEIETVQEENQ